MASQLNSTTTHTHVEGEWETIKGECPTCKRNKGWCSESTDGTRRCCRFESEGAVYSGTDCNGSEFHIHVLVPEEDDARPRKPRGKPASSPRKKPAGPTPALADADSLHGVYTTLLAGLSLSPAHRDDLVERRKFPAGDPERLGYRSVPRGGIDAIVAGLVERFGAATLLKVPGFYQDQGKIRLSCSPGLIIPVRDALGRIVALLSRPDKTLDGGKYRWVSSKKRGGPGPGCPTHVPLDCSKSET